jgi:uncharacterized protein (DUF427 family)
MSKLMLQPSPEHPITVTPTGSRVVVRVSGRVVADSANALTLQEADYPAVQYIPMDDVDKAVLRPTETTSYCPFKGDASYYSVDLDGDVVSDVIWSYQNPYPAVAEIAGHTAFYPDRADITVAEADAE